MIKGEVNIFIAAVKDKFASLKMWTSEVQFLLEAYTLKIKNERKYALLKMRIREAKLFQEAMKTETWLEESVNKDRKKYLKKKLKRNTPH